MAETVALTTVKEGRFLNDITNRVSGTSDLSWQLCKREKFAVSLRKEKKKQILSKKRAILANNFTAASLISFADLHPAFSDRYTTVVSKHLLSHLFNVGGQEHCIDADRHN